MLNREKIIKGLEHCQKVNTCNADCFYFVESPVTDGKCIEAWQADALALLKEQEWISVKDRLPNCNGCYIVWRPHFYPDKGMPSICYFDG